MNYHSDAAYDLKPLFCGIEDCAAGHFYGPAVRSHYLIHCVLNGSGVFRYKEKTRALSQGDCFMIFPGEVTFYRADDDNPWSYIWIAFTGRYAGELSERAGLNQENSVFGNEKILRLFSNLNFEMKSGVVGPKNSDSALLSVIYAVFASLPYDTEPVSRKDLYISQVEKYVESMYACDISIERMARSIGLDRRYLCSIFKRRTGRTLQEYVIARRMEKARELLSETRLSVGDVARSVGYPDVYGFSKRYKAKYGESPMKFRENRSESGSKETRWKTS